jgi:hypothetical protein
MKKQDLLEEKSSRQNTPKGWRFMAEEWYYTSKGQQCGPVSFATLAKLANSGHIIPSDYVWQAGMSNWVPGSTITGLFPTPPPIESRTREVESKHAPLQYPVASKSLKSERKNFGRSTFNFSTPMLLIAIAGGGIAIGWFLNTLRLKTPIQKLADSLSAPNQPPFPIPDFGKALKNLTTVQPEIRSATFKFDYELTIGNRLKPNLYFEASVSNISSNAISNLFFYVRLKDPQRSIPAGDAIVPVNIRSGIEPGETKFITFAVPVDTLGYGRDSAGPNEILEIAIVTTSRDEILSGKTLHELYGGSKFAIAKRVRRE